MLSKIRQFFTKYKYLFSKIFAVIFLVSAIFVLLNFNYIWYALNSAMREQGRVEVKPKSLNEITLLPADYLYIESLNIKAPIVYVEEQSEKVYQAALKKGAVHFPGTAMPGQPGNVYIFGHSSDYIWSGGEFKTIFAPLTKIQPGDMVQISDTGGANYFYKVTESFVASAKDTHLLSQETEGKKILTLQTSWPLGTALKRWIVVAELIQE